MNNSYTIEPLFGIEKEELTEELKDWIISTLESNEEKCKLSEALEDPAALREHIGFHVLVNKKSGDKIQYEIFDEFDAKIPNKFIINESEEEGPQYKQIEDFYYKEALDLVSFNKSGNSKDNLSNVVGFVVKHEGIDKCIKIRVKSKYIIPPENMSTGSSYNLSTNYSDFVSYNLKDDARGYTIYTYFIAFNNKLRKEREKFVRELTPEEKNIPSLKNNSNNANQIATIYFVNTSTKTIGVEDMILDDAIKLYQSQFNGNFPEKRIFKIDGAIPDDRKVKYPAKNKKKTEYFNKLEIVYGVDLTGDAIAKVEGVAEGLEYKLSEEFINSFLKALGVDRVRGLDEELIEARLKDAVEFTNGDTTKGFDSETFKFLIESHTVISALHCLNEEN